MVIAKSKTLTQDEQQYAMYRQSGKMFKRGGDRYSMMETLAAEKNRFATFWLRIADDPKSKRNEGSSNKNYESYKKRINDSDNLLKNVKIKI